MKIVLYLLLLFTSVGTFGQKTLKDFKGTLFFKETYYAVAFTRTHSDTLITYYTFDVDSAIEITEISVSHGEDRSFKFLKFLFTKKNDSLFINYNNPITKKNKMEVLYPLNKRDTISPSDAADSYKLYVDSELYATENNISKYRKVIKFCNDDSYESIYKGDTTIAFKEFSFDCYVIEQNYHNLRNMYSIRKRVFIDKKCLIPVYEDEFSFHKRSSKRFPVANKWVRTKELKIIEIED